MSILSCIMSKLPPFSIGKAFFLSLFAVAIGASKANSDLPSSYNATNKAIIQITESMNNEKILEIKELLNNHEIPLQAVDPSKVLEFKNFINEISGDVSDLNNGVYELLVLLKDIQSNIAFLKKNRNFFAKQVAESAKMYIQYVESLENILSIKRELNVDLTKNEKNILREMQLIRSGLRDISITIKDIYFLSFSKKKNKKLDIEYCESKIKYSLYSSVNKSNKYFSA